MVTNLWYLRIILGVAAKLAKRWGRSTWNVEMDHVPMGGLAGPLAGQSQLASLTGIGLIVSYVAGWKWYTPWKNILKDL